MVDLNKIKSKISTLSKSNNVPHQNFYDTFLFERFLYLLANSKFKTNFVFKGGFLLENIVGINNRSTMDMDFKIQNITVNKDYILNIFSELCESSNEVLFQIVSIEEITSKAKYPGLSVKIIGKFNNIKKIFKVDIAVGDIVTPSPILYQYVSIIDDLTFEILAYNKETILSEKIQTIISKGTNNSRSKDLYDIYLLNGSGYNKKLFNEALKNTFSNRETILEKASISKVLKQIYSSELQKERFENYIRNNEYTQRVSFDEVIKALYEVFESIEF